tara:strand:- start:4006 stop:4560 length:555 start_codon:yes stop_codon:yes gene_type:complete
MSSGFSYKGPHHHTGPQGHLITKYLRLSGSDAGTNNAVGNYSVNTGSFYLQPPAGEIWRIRRMMVNILNTGSGTDIDEYCGVGVLSNGIQITVQNGSTLDLTNSDPVKKITDWGAYCYDIDLKNKVNGNNTSYCGVRWTFAETGQEVRLIGDNNDRLEVTCRDNLTGLSEHRFLVQGYKENDQY